MKTTLSLLVAVSCLSLTVIAQDNAVRPNIDTFVRAETDHYFRKKVERVGIGKFAHDREPTPVDKQTVVRMNRDTPYSQGVFDLTTPVTIVKPDTKGRFQSILVINQNHHLMRTIYEPGTYTFTQEEMGTRYIMMTVRTFVDPNDPEDLEQMRRLQDETKIVQMDPGTLDLPEWDLDELEKLRKAILTLTPWVPDSKGMFGRPEEVDSIRHFVGTAGGFGGNREEDAIYLNVVPTANDGTTPHTLTVRDVPVDAFWSVIVYNKDGFFEAPVEYTSVNGVTAKKDDDGSTTIHFGGDPKAPNYLRIMPDWNYMVRLYRPRKAILDGTWKFPEAQPTLEARPQPERPSEPDRTSLPIDLKPIGGTVGPTAKDSMPPRIESVRAPKDAPNVVVVLLDDVGFGSTGTFGGPIETPASDALAKEGLRFNRFHTTALCSPTRASLLTGRNHHAVNSGVITEFATAFDGYSSVIPRSAASVAQVLQHNGYSTGCFGKWHNTPVWEVSPAGPFDRWPTSLGFDEFYGFMGGEAHQYFPGLFHGTTPIERPEHSESYHLTTDLVDQSLAWLNRQKAAAPDKPFFVYFAPGATHAPHHVAPEWVKRYEGKFEQGWDRLREETFERQKELGVIPADAKLTPRHESIPAWDSLDPTRRKIAAKLMEVYAGFLAHTDHEIGRLVRGIKDLGQWDNTLFIYIIGDNGAAAAGGIHGCFNEMVGLNGLQEDPAVVLQKVTEFGGPKASNEYAVGHAWAMDTPFQFTKQFAGHLGGIRNPMIVTWPKRITDRGGLRSQFHHVTDVVPTIYEAAGVPAPRTVNGFAQMPIHGTSMVYTFADAQAAGRKKTQYFEIMGTRGIYHDGWMASTFHEKIQWAPRKSPAFDNDRWELYHLDADFSQRDDLAAQYPDKLDELKELFLREAKANNALPLDDRGPNRVVGSGRPNVVGDRTSFTLRDGSVRLPEDMIRTTFNRSYAITAALEVPKEGEVEGVLLTAGGYFGGLSLYVKESRPQFTYNYFGSEYTTIAGKEGLPTGAVTLRYEFTSAGGGLGKGGTAKLFVNDRLAAEGTIPATAPLGFSADEGLDVGEDTGTPAGHYNCPFRFTGKIDKVTVDLK